MKTGSLLAGLTVAAALHAPAQEGDKVEQYRGMLLKRPENAVLFGRLVDAWLEKGEISGLKDYLESKTKEGGVMDWRLLAVFRNFAGDEAGAIAALDEALKLAPEDPRARLARAKALGAASRFEDALADLQIAAKNPEGALEAGNLRGKFLARAGKPEEAVKAWKEIIAANPADEGLREDLIELEIGEGLMDEAVASARELSDKTADPYQKALRRLRVAEILAQAGKKNEAVEEYTQVFGVSAEESWLEREVLARVSALFTREDDMGGLKEFHQKLRDSWPRRVAVKKESARSLMATGEGDEAVALFREVIKVMPGDRAVREEFIALLEGAGRMKDAADEIAALLATNDKDAVLWEKLAGVRKALGDEAGSKAALDRAVELSPNDENGKLAAAALLERYGRKDDAERVLREAATAFGAAGDAGDAFATLLANHGKRDEAVKLWQEMGKTADREGLMRITRSLTANGQAALAFEILTSRMGDFKDDPLLLAALCQSAQFSDKSESAIPQAFELVRQAKTTGDLENALRQAVAIVFRAKEPRKWIDELAAKANPSTQELCLLSEMHETLGDSIEAERILKKAMEGGDPLLAAAQRVRLFEFRSELDAAVAATRDWIALPGGMKTEQIKRLVGLYERMDNPEAALKEIDNWKRIAPGDKIAWTTRADLLRRDGKADEAVAELRRALAKFGADEEMRSNLASTMMEAGLTDEAGRMYAALHDEADSAASKVKWAGSMAELAAREGKEEDLINDFKRRARENPSSVAPLLALAEVYRVWQRPDEELQTVAEASRRKPDDVSLIQRLADLEEQAGSVEKAENLLKSAIRVQDSPENRRRLWGFWIRNGDPERGLNEMLADKSASGPRDVERIVEPLMTSGDHQAALRILTAEAPRHPEDWRLAYLHALASKETGAKDDAFKRFSILLGEKREIKGLTPVMQRNSIFGGGGQVEMSNFAKFNQFQAMTAASSNRRRSMYYGMNPAQLMLPGTINELHWMAACHALQIAKEDAATREARLATLSADDLPDLDVIKSAYWMELDALEKRLEADDADPRLFRWYVESGNFGYGDPFGRRKVNSKLLLKGAERCAAKDAELALQAMGRLGFSGEDGLDAKGAARMLELIAGLPVEKKPDYCNSLQMLIGGDEKVVSKELKERAFAMLLEQLKVLREKNGGTWIEDSLAAQWIVEGRFDEAVGMLNSSYQYRKDPKNTRKAGVGQSGGAFSGFLQQGFYPGQENPLKFPDVLSTSVNYQVLSLGDFGNSGRGYRLPAEQKKILELLGEKEDAAVSANGTPAKPVDSEGLIKMLPKVEDPFERVLFAQIAKKPELVAMEIESLVKNHADDPAALMTAAAYHLSVTKDIAKGYATLTAAVGVVKDGNLRTSLDWQIYQTGLQLAKGKTADADLDPARRAALRLRKSMGASDESKRTLADGMKKLGLEEESRRFMAAPQTIRGGASRYFGMSRMASRSRSSGQQLAALVAQGKRDAAARQVLREISSFRSTQNQGMGYSNYQENQCYEAITSLKLENEVMKVGAPPEGAGFKSRKEYALLLVRIHKPDVALPMLRVLAEEKKDDFEVRAALLTALPREEQKSYVLELPEAKFDADRIAGWFNNALENGGNRKVEDFLANVGLFVMFVEKLPVSFEADCNLTWVNYIGRDLFQNYYFNDVRLRRMRSEDGGNPDKVDEARSKERDELARRLYRAMLRHPQTSEQGFILMEYHRGELGFTDDELSKSACGAVELGFRLKEDSEEVRYNGYSRRQNLWLWITAGGGSNSRGSFSGGVDPMTWLLRNAADGKGVNPVSPEAIAKIAESDPKQAKLIEECLKVVDSPGLAGFNEWKEKLKISEGEKMQAVRWLSRLASFRNRPDLLDASVDLICELALANTQDYRSQNEFGECIALSVSRAKGIQEKTKVIDRITRRLLGPPEAWKLYGDRNGVTSNTIQWRMGLYQQMVEPFQTNRDDLVAFSRFALENQIWVSGYVSFEGYSSLWRKSKDAAATAKDWCSSGVFSPGPAPVCVRSDGGSQLMLEAMSSFVSNNGSSSDEQKRFGEELLKTEGADRFWARIFGAHLAGNPKPAMEELSTHAKEIAKWPPHAKLGVIRLIGSWFPGSRDSMDASLKRMLADSEKKGDAEARRKAEVYLKDGFDQNVQPYSLESGELGKIMRSLMRDDPALAAKLWSKALEHFDHTQGGGSSSSNGFIKTSSQYSNLQLFQLFNSGTVPVSDVAAFIRSLEKERPGATSGMFDSEQSYYVSQYFDRWMESRRNEFAAMKSLASVKAELRPLAGSLLAVNEETSKDAMGVAAGLFIVNSVSSYSNASNYVGRSDFRDWIRKSLAKDAPLLADAALVASLSRMETKNATDADKADLRRVFVSLMRDASISAELRVMCMYQLASKSETRSWLDDSACTSAMADVLVALVLPGTNWASSQSFSSIETLGRFKNCQEADAKRVMAAVNAAPVSFASSGNYGAKAEARMTRMMLSLALKAGAKDEIPRLVKQAGSSVRGDLSLAQMLWQADQSAAAVTVLARPGEYHQGSKARFRNTGDGETPKVSFDREMESALPAWLASIDDVGQRFRIECLYSGLGDAKNDAAPAKPRKERLAALVARFPAEAPKARVSREEILASFTAEPDVTKPLADEYLGFAASSQLGQLLPLRDGNSDNPEVADATYATEVVLRRAMRLEIEAKGDASVVLKQLESIIGAPGTNQEYYANEMFNELGRWYPVFYLVQVMERPQDQRAAMAAKALKICEFLLIKERSELHRVAVALAIASQAAAGDGAALDKWLEQLPEPQKSRFVDCRAKAGLKGVFGQLRNEPFTNKESEKARAELLLALLLDRATCDREIKHMTDISAILDSGAVSREEVVAAIDHLPADHPRRAEILTEKAGIIGWRTDSKENALTAYDEAEKAAGGDAKMVDYVHCYRAMYLDTHGDQPKAVEIARTIQPESLKERERKTLEQILNHAKP